MICATCRWSTCTNTLTAVNPSLSAVLSTASNTEYFSSGITFTPAHAASADENIVHLNEITQQTSLVALAHGMAQHAKHQLRSAPLHPDHMRQMGSRNAAIVYTHQSGRREPRRQRQLGCLIHRAGGYRGLMAVTGGTEEGNDVQTPRPSFCLSAL